MYAWLHERACTLRIQNNTFMDTGSEEGKHRRKEGRKEGRKELHHSSRLGLIG